MQRPEGHLLASDIYDRPVWDFRVRVHFTPEPILPARQVAMCRGHLREHSSILSTEVIPMAQTTDTRDFREVLPKITIPPRRLTKKQRERRDNAIRDILEIREHLPRLGITAAELVRE